MLISRILSVLALAFLVSCTSKSDNEIWIYTSLYKDTISDIKPRLETVFPKYQFKFFQAGSEEIASKVNAEILAGGTKADILISSDRFWYEEMAANGQLHAYQTDRVKRIPTNLRHPQGLYNTLSVPVMVLAYNSESFKGSQPPTSFKDLIQEKWKGQFSTGSPLASGTNFTTVAFLSKTYGWDFFKKLQNNQTISQGGNSAVLRRIQNRERPVGWVLLENILRFQEKDKRLKTIFPSDGVVIHNNVLGIVNKDKDLNRAEEVAAWFFGREGQQAMVRSFMYSPFEGFDPPVGAPAFKELSTQTFQWTPEFVSYVVKNRESIKEKFAEIMFN